MNLDKIINLIREMNEEAPTMSVGAGGIAGLEPDQPPVNLKKRKKERKYMKGPGRKVWMDFLKGNG
jgi:hypothetical protein